MAFFKFRFPGRNASVEALASGPNENIEVVRRRARYRLIGAVVLVLIAVVGFPLVFDTQPRPVAVDTPIVIPDRQAVAPLTASAPVPAAQAPAKPWKIAPETLSTQAGLDPREEVVPPSAPAAVAVQETKPEPVEKPKEKQADKPKEKADAGHAKDDAKALQAAKDKADAEAKAKSKSKVDADKAKALLEGKSASSERVIIQVGAFSDAGKLREVRQKLEKSGFKTYTQVVEGKDGKPTTRVRVGPYDSRDEADKAAARIRKLDLSPAVLKI
jgi:DedD protein